jgi:protein O-mannosyl-transferase
MTTANPSRIQLQVAICLALALVTAALYWPLLHHGFVNLDDQAYITANPHVQSGLTRAGLVWAFQIGYAAYWHPLTWLSHMLDCQLYGLNPAGHHLTNLLLHIANTLLLFVWLNQLTRTVWRSAFVAALFAWHPLHVESVAWACERKDVLSAFFFLLTLLTYTSYVSHKTGRASRFYILSLFLFALGLMSKPMVVTLPFVLLLLDFWPLGRISECGMRNAELKTGPRPSTTPVLDRHANRGFNGSTIQRLLLEKLPFFALTLAGSAVTYFAQKGGGAVWSAGLPLATRLANALVSYLRYLSKTFWPVDLAAIYPYPHHWPAGLVMAAVLVLAFWTGLFLWRARRNPYWFVGWLWFLGTLVPTIGIVQAGPQAMADRFTYLPGIGLFIIVAWALSDLVNFRPRWRLMATLTAAAALAACLVVARIQLSYWPDSITLLRHAIAVTTDNYIAYNSLGRALDDAGQKDEALVCYSKSVQIESHFPSAQFNLGMAWLNRGRPAEAVGYLSAAVQLVPDNAGAHYYLGTAMIAVGRLDDATAQFTEALRLDPEMTAAHYQLALALIKQGKTAEAIPHFAGVVRQQPDNPEARFNLGLALLDMHQPAEAAGQFAEELRLKPDETRAHYRLAQALQQLNQPAEAARHYREALRLTPEFPEAKKALDEILAAHPELR